MPAIRDERMALRGAAQHRRARAPRGRGGGLDGAPGRRKAERHHLDRQRKPAEHRHPLGVVGDDDHAGRCRGNDLFAQQCAAAALDDGEVGGDLVGAVHREVELRRLVERRQRNAEPRRVRPRSPRRSAPPMTSRPSRTRAASSSTKCRAVEPVPSPSRMPGCTNSSARAAAARLRSSEAVHDGVALVLQRLSRRAYPGTALSTVRRCRRGQSDSVPRTQLSFGSARAAVDRWARFAFAAP